MHSPDMLFVGSKAPHLFVTELWNNKLQSVLQDDDGLNRIRPSDETYVYEIPAVDTIPSKTPFLRFALC